MLKKLVKSRESKKSDHLHSLTVLRYAACFQNFFNLHQYVVNSRERKKNNEQKRESKKTIPLVQLKLTVNYERSLYLRNSYQLLSSFHRQLRAVHAKRTLVAVYY